MARKIAKVKSVERGINYRDPALAAAAGDRAAIRRDIATQALASKPGDSGLARGAKVKDRLQNDPKGIDAVQFDPSTDVK